MEKGYGSYLPCVATFLLNASCVAFLQSRTSVFVAANDLEDADQGSIPRNCGSQTDVLLMRACTELSMSVSWIERPKIRHASIKQKHAL